MIEGNYYVRQKLIQQDNITMKTLLPLLLPSALIYAVSEMYFANEMGQLIGNEPLCFILTYATEIVTVCAIPVMLKWLGKSLYSQCVIAALVLINTIMYCLTLTPAFGYLILICLLVIPFVYGKADKKEEK